MIDNEPLEYGEHYALWREDEFIGTATFVDDEIHGGCFIKEVEFKGKKVKEVYIADRWEKVKQ